MAVDGSLIFNTKIDDDGFNKGTKGMSSKVVDLKNKISSTETAIKNLKAEMEKTANTKVKTKVAEGLEKDIAKAKERLSDFYVEADRIGDVKQAELKELGFSDDYLDKALAQDKAWQQIQEKIDKAEAQVQRYKNALEQANAVAPLTKDTVEFQQKEQRLNNLSGQLDVYNAKLREAEQAERSQSSATATAADRLATAKRHLERTISALKMFANGAHRAGNMLKSAFSKTAGRLISNIAAHFKRANNSTNVLEKSLRRIKNTLIRMFFFRLVHSPIDAIKDGLGEIAKVSPTVNKNLSALKTESTYLKNSLAALAAPLVNLITPALTTFMQTLSGVTEKAGRIVAILTGQSYTKAVKVQQDYAASLDETTNSANKNTKALEKNQHALAGFDELNVMDNNSDDSSDSAAAANPMFQMTDAAGANLSKSLLDSLKSQDFKAVGKLLGDKINSGLRAIKWGNIKSTLKSWAGNIADFLNGFIETTDWGKVGSTISNGISATLDFISTLIKRVDYSAMSKGIVDAVTRFDFAEVGRGASNLINGFASALHKLDFKAIGSAFRNGLAKVNWENIWNGVTRLMTNALKGLTDFFGMKGIGVTKLKNALRDIATPVTELYGTLKSTANELLAPIINDFLPEAVNAVGSIFKAVKPVIKAVTPVLKKTTEVITGIVKSLAPVVETVGETISSIVNLLSPILQPILDIVNGIVHLLAPVIDAIMWCVKGIADFLSPITEAVGGIFSWLTGGNGEPTISAQLRDELDNLSDISDDLTNVRDNINGAITSVDENLAATAGDLKYIDGLQNRLEELMNKATLSDQDFNEIKTIGDLLSKKLPGFQEAWNDIIGEDGLKKDEFIKHRTEMSESIQGVIDDLKAQYATEALEEQYKELYRQKVESNKDIAESTADVTEAQKLLSEKTKAYYEELDKFERTTQKDYENGLVSQPEYDAAIKNLNNLHSELVTYKTNLENAESNALRAYAAQGKMNDKMSSLNDTMDVMNGKFDKAKDSWQKLRNAYDNGFIDLDTIKKQFDITGDELFKRTKSAADMSIAGMKAGIDNGWFELNDMGVNVASTVYKATCKELGIHSPSKKFEEIGDYDIRGLELGIEKRTPRLLALIQSLAGQMTRAMRNGLERFSTAFDNLPELFRGTFNVILSEYENFLSHITDGLNQAFIQINQLNRAFAQAGSGGRTYTTWAPSAPIHVPRLATGAAIPANYGEFLAVLGDNKRETEVVSPLSTMKQAFMEALAESNFSGDSGEKEINLYIDGDKFFTWLIGKNNRYQKTHGQTAFGGGEA